MDAQEFIVEHAVERLIAVQHHVEAVVEGDADDSNSDSDSDNDSDSDSDSDSDTDNEGNGGRENDQGEQAPVQAEIPPIQAIARPVVPIAPIAALPPPARPAGEQNDDMDDFNMDELDGILEVIGMHGSLWQLLQNSLLMSALICASLGAGVWLPFTIGKTILLMRLFNVLRFPLNVLSRLTDPILDYVFDHVLPSTSAAVSKAITTLNSKPLEILYQDYVLPMWSAIVEINASGISQDVHSNDITTGALDSLGAGQTLNATTTANTTNATFVQQVTLKWTEMAYGTSSGDKFAAIIIGYAILLVFAFWCYAQTRNAYRHTFARTARDVLRQQGLVLKVNIKVLEWRAWTRLPFCPNIISSRVLKQIACFVAYEMLVFPLVCGVVIGLSTLPLFRGASIGTRIAFFKFSPNWSLIMHWMVGTAFTYGFALFVRHCRRIARPGAMWFLRDPNDEGVHPAREILERPALVHLRTLAQATLLYFSLIILGVTVTIHSVNLLFEDILPLRWPVE